VTRRARALLAALAAAVAALTTGSSALAAAPVQHVLPLSVDGLHQSDLAWWVRQHPNGSLARLVRHGASCTNAATPIPSDSSPGLVGQLTGGDPAVTGIYYDDTYNRALLPSGTRARQARRPGSAAR
jgi:hypothetical protein